MKIPPYETDCNLSEITVDNNNLTIAGWGRNEKATYTDKLF